MMVPVGSAFIVHSAIILVVHTGKFVMFAARSIQESYRDLSRSFESSFSLAE